MKKIHHRKNYDKNKLDEKDCPDSPLILFHNWFEMAHHEETEVYKMVLSTIDSNNRPQSRILLLREYSEKGFTFFTNYNSNKGKELKENPFACLLFDWEREQRQVRINGKVKKIAEKDSIEYFNSRPLESRQSAIASSQSKKIKNREELENKLKSVIKEGNFEKPNHWGGYILVPDYIEFWQGRPNRLHDRIIYEKKSKTWKKFRLQP